MSTAKKVEHRGTFHNVECSPVLCCSAVSVTANKSCTRTEEKEELEMAGKDCSCWNIVDCNSSKECPDKCDSGKTCWEISFLHNNWQKVFEKCRYCKVFQQDLLKHK